jgi:hypothetical protein
MADDIGELLKDIAAFGEALSAAIVQGLSIGARIDEMHKAQRTFTTTTVETMMQYYPGYNVLVTCQSVDRNLVGEVHVVQVLGLPFPFGSRTYDIFLCKSGELTRHGDGGYENWAFNGNYVREGDHVTFSPIEGMRCFPQSNL